MGSTSLDLSQIKTDALASAASFRTLIGVDLTSYLPLAGGTMTGQLGLNGHAKLGGVSAGVAGVYQADGTTEGQLNSKILCGGTGFSEILPTRISYLFGNSNGVVLENGGVSIGPSASYWFADGNAGITKDTRFQRVSANVVALKNAGTTLGTLQAASVSNPVGDLMLYSMGYINLYCDGGLRAVTTSTSFRPATINMYDLGEETYPYKSGYFATSVVTPLVDNPSAALTLGNATHGVSVPGASTFSGNVAFPNTKGFILTGTIGQALCIIDSGNSLLIRHTIGHAYFGTLGASSLFLQTNGANRLTINSAGTATFSGLINSTITSGPALQIGTVVTGYGGFSCSGTMNANSAAVYGNGTLTIINVPNTGSLGLRINNDIAGQGGLTMTQHTLNYRGNNGLTIRNTSDTAYGPLVAGSGTFSGPVVLPEATTSIPSINIPAGAAPTSPADGDMWCVGDILYRRIGGVTKSITFA